MKCVEKGIEKLDLPALDELDWIEVFPVVHEPTYYAFPESFTTSETTCAVSVTVAEAGTYNGVFCYAQSPWGLATLNNLNSRLLFSAKEINQMFTPLAEAQNDFENAQLAYLGTMVGVAVGPTIIPKTAVWIKRRFLYEAGSKTIATRRWLGTYSRIGDPVRRGARMLEAYRKVFGPVRGTVKWILPEGRGWFLGIGKTFSTGPTPGGWAAVAGGSLYIWNRFFSDTAEDADEFDLYVESK